MKGFHLVHGNETRYHTCRIEIQVGLLENHLSSLSALLPKAFPTAYSQTGTRTKALYAAL